MARTDTLGHFLTDVADAIRTKTGSSDTIAAEDFDTEIENIPSGTNIPEISTEEAMDALCVESNYGKKYKYTGTESKYANAIYEVNRELINNGIVLNDMYLCPSTNLATGDCTIDCSIGSKLIAFISLRDSTYTLSEGWTVLGVSEEKQGSSFYQYMIVATKTATSTSETLSVTQGSSTRMYINIVEVPSDATITLSGFQYGSGGGYIDVTNQSGMKIYGLSNGTWSTSAPYYPWTCNSDALTYYGASINHNIQQRQGLFAGKIDTSSNLRFSTSITTDTFPSILAIITITNITPVNLYNYYFNLYNADTISDGSGLAKYTNNISLENAATRSMAYLFRYTKSVGKVFDIIYAASLFSSTYVKQSLEYVGEIVCSKLSSSLVVSGIITNANVTLDNMFSNCNNLKKVEKLDTKYTYSMHGMFNNCSKLTSIPPIDVSNFNNSIDNMFIACSNLKEISFVSNTQKTLSSVYYAFYNCVSLEKLDLSVFDLTTVTNTDNDIINSFFNVPDTCLIIVADQTQKDWFATKLPRFTNVQTITEYENQ